MPIFAVLKVNYMIIWIIIVVLSFGATQLAQASGTPLFGLAGQGGGAINQYGFTISGSGFSRVDFDHVTGTEQILLSNGESFIATTCAYDPATHRMYLQKVKSDGVYLAFVDTSSSPLILKELARLTTPFRFMVFDPDTGCLFGLAGPGGAGAGPYGVTVSGTSGAGFKRIDPNHITGSESILWPCTDSFIATTVALDSYSHKMFLQKVKNDGVYLVSVNTKTGEPEELTPRLSAPFMQFVFDPVSRWLFGVILGTGQANLEGQHGVTVPGSDFKIVDPSQLTNQEQIFNSATASYIGTASFFDPSTSKMYIQKVKSDGTYLVSIDTNMLFINPQKAITEIQPYLANPLKLMVMCNPPPSELTLAKMSQNAYFDNPNDIDGYKYKSVFNGGYAFHYIEYQNDQQVVYAFRGTVPDRLYPALYTFLADYSWLKIDLPNVWNSGDITEQLLHYVEWGAIGLKSGRAYPYNNANITLTGHSLGGAIAQILAVKTGLPAVAFNAPKTGKIIINQEIINKLAILEQVSFQNSGKSINFRLYGDVISQAGTEYLNSFVRTIDTTYVLKPLAGYYSSFLDNHSIANLISQMAYGAPQTLGIPDPLYENIIVDAAGMLIHTAKNWSFKIILSFTRDNVLMSQPYGLDPEPANEFEIISQPGSPPFASLVLPNIPGVKSYGVRLFADNNWGDSFTLSPLQKFAFSTPKRGFKFWPLDSTGKIMTMPDGFIFDVTFASSGNFKGTLQAKRKHKAVPFLELLLLR